MSVSSKFHVISAPLAMLLIWGSVTSCAYLKEVVGIGPLRPKVTLSEIEVKHVSMVALSLEIAIKVDNPNDFDLKLKNLKYDMVASEVKLADGTYREEITIPASGNTIVKLPVAVDPNHAIKLIKHLLQNGKEIIATVNAEADFATPFGDTEVSFEETKPLRKFVGM